MGAAKGETTVKYWKQVYVRFTDLDLLDALRMVGVGKHCWKPADRPARGWQFGCTAPRPYPE